MASDDKESTVNRGASPPVLHHEYFIDLLGRARRVGKHNVAVAVAEVGYVHVYVIDRTLAEHGAIDRTVIVRLQPHLISQVAIAALGCRLADLDPARMVMVTELPTPRCMTSADSLTAMHMIARLVRGVAGGSVAVADSSRAM